jgi:tetratricopeptide (TPR) repeat protein
MPLLGNVSKMREKIKMKQWISVVLALLLFLPLSACGQKNVADDSAATWQEQYDLGIRYLSEGNYEEAIIAFTSAIEIEPKQALAYVGRGDAYVLSGETEDNLAAAQTDYETAIELDETNAQAYLGLADVYIRQGKYDKALEILKIGLEKTDDDQSIFDKSIELEQGVFTDSTNHIRRSNGYNSDGELTDYTLYQYDNLDRCCGWENWSYEDSNEDGNYELLDTPFLDNYCKVSFNSQNLPEKNQFYEADGTPGCRDVFLYNEKGQKIEQHRYLASGEKESYFLFYYNDQGQEIRYEGYWADGSMYHYWISEYDSTGNLTKETGYEPDGTVTGYQLYE